MLRSLFAGLWAKTGKLDPPGETWDFETTAESFPAVTTPCTFSFARRLYRHAYRDLARMRGAGPDVLSDHEEVFAGILGYRDGWIGIDAGKWAVFEALLATLGAEPDPESRVLAYLDRLPAVLASCDGLPYRTAEPALFRDAGLLVASDLAVVESFAAEGEAWDAGELAACGPIARGGRFPGELLLETRVPPGHDRLAVGESPVLPPRGLPRWLAIRERTREARCAIFGVARRLLAAHGAGLAPEERWLCSVAELGAGALPPASVLSARRRDLARWRAIASPPPGGTSGPPPALSGIVVWPGQVEGIARVVRDPAQPGDLDGNILVAARTDPGWSPLFARAAAIVLEHGNPLSHAAILARELRIPAVVGVRGLQATVRDGDRLLVDADAGTIRVVDPTSYR